MSSVYLGTTPLKISTEVTFDPRYGFQTAEVYSGPRASLDTLNTTLILLGVRTRISERAGKTYLEAFYAVQDPSGVETPTDFYELETDYVQESVWRNRYVELDARAAAIPSETGLDVLARWRRIIENGLKGKKFSGVINAAGEPEFEKVTDGPLEPTKLVSHLEPRGLLLYETMLRDGLAYETTRQMLTRSRQISINYSAKAVAQAIPLVYLTPDLVTAFAIPQGVADRLPADPGAADTPSGTAWGWKQRRNTSRYEWNGRVAEVMSWTFAAWSTSTYKFS